ncbi:hypothetical protein SDC9_140335 [bioreactor metagenome]|uniref:Tripartite ATP-independent periplasmic transporters DctQ component domain-containing protein n=1 Tax=bioreactor metagenome TaxID=1076179 RepID=A0A645DV71_9ZZZZ|nr:TRAP transporter small permease [Candidatus Pelethousia sp.]NCB30639.1 TRAP transporter small permease [Clostridia bacterium]
MLERMDTYLSRFENAINGGLMLAGVVVLFINVMMRYLFHAASTWVEEALRYAIIWVTFFGGSQCAKNGTHVGIDLLTQSLPETGKRILSATGQFIAGVLNAFCTYAGIQMTKLVLDTAQKSPAILMPMWIVYIAIPLGCGLMTIRFFVAGLNILRHNGPGSLIADEEGHVDMSRL